MIQFQQIDENGKPAHNGDVQVRGDEAQVLGFFQFWEHHPSKKRMFVEGKFIKFEYLSGKEIRIGQVL